MFLYYQRKISKKDVTKRILFSWLIVFVVSLVIGGVVGTLVGSRIAEENRDEQEEPNSFTVYGAYDDKCFTSEVSVNWHADEDFKPLDCNLDEEIQEFLYYLCKGYDIDFTFVMAIIQAESSFNPDIISSTDDYGLMQINKNNHEWITKAIGVKNFTDPKENVRAGCFVIRKLFEKYQNPEMVLMVYHFGEHGAITLWNEGIYESKYSQQVLKYQQQFNEQMEGD